MVEDSQRYQVRAAGNPREALQKVCRRLSRDLLLTDVRMPEMSGRRGARVKETIRPSHHHEVLCLPHRRWRARGMRGDVRAEAVTYCRVLRAIRARLDEERIDFRHYAAAEGEDSIALSSVASFARGLAEPHRAFHRNVGHKDFSWVATLRVR